MIVVFVVGLLLREGRGRGERGRERVCVCVRERALSSG